MCTKPHTPPLVSCCTGVCTDDAMSRNLPPPHPPPPPALLWTSLNSCLAAHCTGNLPSADTGLCQGTVGMYKSALVQLNNKWVFWPDRLTPRPSLGCVPSATVCQGCKSVCNFACCCWLLNPTSNLCRVWGTLPCSVGMASMT